jgi:hypothetical protein
MNGFNRVPYKVLLPEWIWEEAKDKEDLKKLVLQYMRKYPHYSIKKIKGSLAICERR